MSTFEQLTADEKHELLLALYAALFADEDPDLSAMSHNWLWTRTIALAGTDEAAHINATQNDLMPDTSLDDMLVRWAGIRGVVLKGATGARKAKALRVVGTPTTAVPADRELVHDPTGLKFKTTVADVVGASGDVDVDVAAIDVGAQTRLQAGQVLRFSVPVGGLEENAELQLDLDEDGQDAEDPGSIQSRVVSRFQSPPLGGKADDYVQWALEVTGFAAAYCYKGKLRRGVGTVDLAALHAGSGEARIPSPVEVADLQALIDVKRPVSVKAFRVLLVEANATNVHYTYVPDGAPEHEPDWDDSTPPTCLAWTGATRLLQFSGGARPATMKAGDRVAFSDGATGKERIIESLSGADAVFLEPDDEGDIPTGGGVTTVYAGGPLVQTIRQAIIDLIDSLGTANPDAKRYGTWEGNLRPSGIGRVASAVPGNLDGTVVDPAIAVAASDPAFPDDDTVGLITAARILVRRQF